jgi:YfiR/HmsC-like
MNAVSATIEGIKGAVADTGRAPYEWARRYRILLALLLLQLALGAHAQTSREDQIKAAFVYNFTKFIEWPSTSFADANAAIVIGVLGDSPMAAVLDVVVRDRKVNGRPIIVRTIQGAADAASTHVLFVSEAGSARWAQLQAVIETQPVVTVGESPSSAQTGCTINFIVQGDKLHFVINMVAAEQSGVKISAQLQKLAAAVQRVP